jgi:argininosuccinate lyase
MLATDLAEYLVRKGVPFRESHHVAGAAVRMAEVQAIALPDLSLEDLQTLHKAFDEDVAEVWSFEASVDRRDVSGGTSRRSVQEQIDRLRTWLDQQA